MAFYDFKDFKKDYKKKRQKLKKVLLHVDLNCDEFIDRGIIEGTIYKASCILPTIKQLINLKGIQLVITTHLGRPDKERKEKYDTDKIHHYLKKSFPDLLYCKIPDIIENGVTGNLILTDNFRFYDDVILRKFSKIFNFVVTEAFGVSHRTPFYKECKNIYLGPLFKEEITKLDEIKNYESLVFILGGKKLEKLKYLKKINTGNIVILTGLLAVEVIRKNKEFDGFDLTPFNARELRRSTIYFPLDFKTTSDRIVNYGDLEKRECNIADIGPKTFIEIKNFMELNKLPVVMNGTLGIIETKDNYTEEFFEYHFNYEDFIIGGGDTANFAVKFENNYKIVSTGGGSMMKFLLGYTLPGITVAEK